MSAKFTLVLAAAAILPAQSAVAHRIDDYLQATLLSLQPEQIEASMRLIPGISRAPAVIAAIDANGDGLFSDDEQRQYARRVLGDLSISVDGRRLEPTLLSGVFRRRR
jgi:hypothetical protein